MKPVCRLTWAVLAAWLPVAAGAGEWWQGIWAWDKAWCDQAGRIGSVTPAPIAITSAEVLGYENSCAIRRTHELRGMAAVRLVLQCRAEGAIFEESRLIMQGGKAGEPGAEIWIWSGAGAPIRFYRCPEAGPPDDWINRK